ncbi:cytochrome C1 heme lyase [Russula earlei]|uniref:Cytochrome C1 heme lyase n=1 Tax=Russula earlei TaxID=71964 RepID=A0ACC0U3X1_9AGAM|nr:cytochrome C1 heme lyase [Russula earlei]
MSTDKCPVDHKSLGSSCPVDHTARSTWRDVLPHSSDTLSSGTTDSRSTGTTAVPLPESLSTSRETSSIPRSDKENWVYPSEAQFYAAMARKNHDPRAPDMKVVVPIHNAVNERAWSRIKEWEAGRGGERCGGVRLVSFKGRPREPSPKARILTLLGYNPPFDRHDWIVDRCGTRMRYVIDFYAGRPLPGTSNVSFFLDVRPALDSWEAVSMRTRMFVTRWRRVFRETFSGPSSLPPTSADPTPP